MTLLRRILKLEPVAVQGVVRLAFVLLATLGVTISDATSGQVLAAIAATYALIEAATTLWARSRSTPSASVVQVVDTGGVTVAGPASPLPDGTPVHPVLTPTERLSLAQLHDALDEDDPARNAIDVILPRHLET